MRVSVWVVRLLLVICSAGLLGQPRSAAAHSVVVRVIGPTATYSVYLYNELSMSPVGVITGGLAYGGWRDFQFTNCPSGHAYWAKAVRLQDGMTRLAGGSVYLWWYQSTIRLPDITFPYSLSAAAGARRTGPSEATGSATAPSWGGLKNRYRR